mmetsp:Transcript_17541/g.37064  ORF Transcript_17541/g.37064 Transcript_17541/m.37064 type:complete len:763 (+) Transcript_17541:106-2394(+)|eukprot:CAMPEP_0183730264 /NCGR_PEP_ID=MMETSP0737-20130205/32395_1 /TAXON_ID=385413 /ORGANISM="Thalassiosira miniscula, Strain CCMP1093" /LENGTH=762 /DNA_ID=CAMNT_0025962717 /DNA_START=89 /DNA_END=2377 /DNA_ORIENTATION=-
MKFEAKSMLAILKGSLSLATKSFKMQKKDDVDSNSSPPEAERINEKTFVVKRELSECSITSLTSSSSFSDLSTSTTSTESEFSFSHPSELKTKKVAEAWKSKSAIFAWVPSAVHYSVLIMPVLLMAVVYLCFTKLSFPPAAFYLYLAGTICRLLFSALFHDDKIIYTPLTTRHTPSTQNSRHQSKKHVAVIGAGPSGLATAKELLEAGHRVTVYDSAPSIGGEFANRFYPGGKLTSSPYTTSFSDFEPKFSSAKDNKGRLYPHYTKDEYARYLQDYSEHFAVTPHVKLNTLVKKVVKDESSFFVTAVTKSENAKAARDGPFHHVAVCTGQNQVPAVPDSLKTFNGTIMHTSDFWKKSRDDPDVGYADLAGKRVVTIGIGEAMADILKIITTSMSNPPSAICASIRKGAFVIPRTNPLNGMNNDFDSTRLRYALPKIAINYTMDICSKLTRKFSTRADPQRDVRISLMEKLGGTPGYVRATKSDAFVNAVCSGDISMKPAIDRIDGNTVHFVDGTIMNDVDAIVYGTGYDFSQTSFPFLEGLASSLNSIPASCPTKRLFRMFDPDYKDSIAFIGMGVRPLLGSIPTSSEIQARLFAMIVSGERQLPEQSVMEDAIALEMAKSKRDLAPYNANWTGLVNWIPFMDSIAREIGCLPKWHWLVTRPMLWLKLLTGPMMTFHYRLTGPGATQENAKLAESIIQKIPIGSRKRDLVFFASLHACTALLCWPISMMRMCGFLTINFLTFVKKLSQKVARPEEQLYIKEE